MGLRAILLKWDRNISRDFETFVLFLILELVIILHSVQLKIRILLGLAEKTKEYVTIRCVRVSIVVLYRDCPSFSFLIGLLSLEFHIIFLN